MKKKNATIILSFYSKTIDFKVLVCNNTSHQGHDFRHVVMLTQKGVLLVAPFFDWGVDFKVFVHNGTSCQAHGFKGVIILA